MTAVTDINAIWRIKPFEALSKFVDVVGVSPRQWMAGDPPCLASANKDLTIARISLPPGWASHWESWSSRQIVQRLTSIGVSRLFITSPHYLSLTRMAACKIPVHYYCSDDYSQYIGWGGSKIEETESELISLCSHSFFVSRVLADKAIRSGADPSSVSVSENATEPEKFAVQSESNRSLVQDFLSGKRRPIVGVIGAINSRLDFNLLLSCANLPEVGTLLMAGPVDSRLKDPLWDLVKAHPKCVTTGARPHSEIPAWMTEIDVGLIPYADSPLNRACSPMRLFDHLAAGTPVVATSGCDQIREYDAYVFRSESLRDTLELVRMQCQTPKAAVRSPEFLRTISWRSRAEDIARRL